MINLFNKKVFNIFFIILIVLLPLQTRYFLLIDEIKNNFFEYGSISIYLIDLVFLLFAVYGLVYLVKNKIRLNKKSIILLSLLSLFNLSIISSIFFSIDKVVAICYSVKILLLSLFSFIIYLTKINIKWFTNSFIISGSIQAFLSIYQFMLQAVDANKYLGIAEHMPYVLGTYVIEGSFGRVLKSYGAFPHPNILGLFLLLTIIFILFKIIEHRIEYNPIQNKKVDFKMVYLIYVFGINLIGLLFTFSRVAIGLFIVSFISFIIYELIFQFRKNKLYENSNYKLKILSVLSVIVIILGLSSSDMLVSRVDAKNRLVEKSTNERVSQIKDFVTYIKSNYLTGVGIENYSIYKYNQNKDLNVWDIQPIHNIYLMIFIETGIFGLLFFISLPIFKFITNRNIQILIPFLAILLFGMFDHFILTLGFGLILFFLFLGLEDKYDTI